MPMLMSVVFVVLSLAVPVRAGCGFAECGYDRASLDPDQKRWLRADYEFEYIDQNILRNGSKQVPLRTQRGHHDEKRTINRIHRARLAGGLTERLSAEAALPYVERYHQHVHRHQGRDLDETWHLSGIGDLLLEFRYDFLLPRETKSGARWTAIAGAEFPTGDSKQVNEEGDQADPPVQPGSDSFDYFFGAGVARPAELFGQPVPLFASAIYRINRPGFRRYRIGDLLQVNAGLSTPVYGRLAGLLQLNFTHKNIDDKGDTSEEIDKTGGDYLYVSAGPEIRLYDGLALQTIVQLPVYQRVNKVQLTAPYNLLTRLSWRWAY